MTPPDRRPGTTAVTQSRSARSHHSHTLSRHRGNATRARPRAQTDSHSDYCSKEGPRDKFCHRHLEKEPAQSVNSHLRPLQVALGTFSSVMADVESKRLLSCEILLCMCAGNYMETNSTVERDGQKGRMIKSLCKGLNKIC